MKLGHCPICNSTEVYQMVGKTPLIAGAILKLEVKQDTDWRSIDLNTYVCANCGYTAMFANSPQGLAFLKTADGWRKVAD